MASNLHEQTFQSTQTFLIIFLSLKTYQHLGTILDYLQICIHMQIQVFFFFIQKSYLFYLLKTNLKLKVYHGFCSCQLVLPKITRTQAMQELVNIFKLAGVVISRELRYGKWNVLLDICKAADMRSMQWEDVFYILLLLMGLAVNH